MRVLFLCFILVFIAVIVKLFALQVISAKTYTADYLTTEKLYPERGKIFDRSGEPMAVNQVKYQLYVEPKHVSNRFELIDRLDALLQIGKATLESRIDPTKDWTAVKGGLSDDQKKQITALKLPGVGFINQYDRYYPESSLSAHLIGFVGKNSEGENVGYSGIEGFYDKELAGLPGFMKSERDLIGRPIFFGTQERLASEDGRDLILTIDKAVQKIVKEKLVAGVERYKAKEGCIIVADPMSMEILALACVPDFDPSEYYKYSEDNYKNPAISNLYEPGSTFKPLIVAAGIESKSIKPDEEMDEDGPVKIGEYQIRTWDNKYAGKVNMTQILEKSSNVGMVYIGSKMGNDKVFDYIHRYGFGRLTDIDLQGEAPGYLKNREDWYPIDYATATFGQGIAVSAIQMVRAFSAVVNGGKLLRPYVVKEIVDGQRERKREPHVVENLLSERTSEILKKMLVYTVENGEVKWARPQGYKIGGKTGTAQIAVQGKYDASKTIASFIGFAPADHPKFVALVILREPGTSEWGSETAAPIFFDITKELLVYYNIAPQ